MSILKALIAASNQPDLWNQQSKLIASDAAEYDVFGSSAASSSDGGTCAIGARFDDNSGGSDAGSVYIFTRSGTTWSQQARLQASDATGYDHFGTVVALSSDGNTCVIGSPDDVTSGGTSGSVYVFTRSGSTWSQQARVQASDATTGDSFGSAIALSSDGNTCVTGASFEDNPGGSDAGSAYVFTRSGSTWSQQVKLLASDASGGDFFGRSVALSSDGNTCAIGAAYDINPSSGTGSVYVFTRSGSTWSQQTRFQSSDTASGDVFGSSVALSSDGNTCAIGARFDDNSGGDSAGSVYIFTRSGSTWSEQARLQASDAAVSDLLGGRVALSENGSICAIAADYDDTVSGVNSGSVYVFTRSGSTWAQQVKLQASDAAANDYFGTAVALSGDGTICIITSPYDDHSSKSDVGSAYVFIR